jgi:hypothetical protein
MNNKIEEQTFSLLWKSIPIEIIYIPDYAPTSKEILGYRLVHLQVISKNRVPLPFTETGYRSPLLASTYLIVFEKKHLLAATTSRS